MYTPIFFLLFVLPYVAFGTVFPPAVDSNLKCAAQPHHIADPRFDIQKMKSNTIYNSLYFYQLNEGDPGYQACYVNVFRSKSPIYDCSIIGLYNCVDTANHFLSSYATVRTNGGTVCYALSTYPDLETATFLGVAKTCIVSFIVNVGDDPCAELMGANTFTPVSC